jgi:GAG-pre-integrase domain
VNVESNSEDAFRVSLSERISDEFEHLIGEERACQAKGRDDPVIDSGATRSCSSEIELFESLDQKYRGTLGTASKSTRIAGKGTMNIPLSGGKSVRLSNVLYVPSMTQTLLSTQTLYADGIWNEHVKEGYRFFRKRGDILATGYNIGRTSYLGWVKHTNALITRSPDDEREFARLVNQTDWKLIHQRLGHPGMKRSERIVKEMGLVRNKDDILEHCETCIQAKSVKRQNRKSTPWISGAHICTHVKNKDEWKYYLSLTTQSLEAMGQEKGIIIEFIERLSLICWRSGTPQQTFA